jgi:glyoxylase-like metal-dependent hydrolase (beta-lactamase superfamily II)
MVTQTLHVLEIGQNLWQIDLLEQNRPGRSYGFVLRDSLNVLIEVGYSRSVGQLIQGLHQLGIRREDLHYLIVTHIHLDHAGGVGTLAKLCPNAKIIVHPRGARHLIDPTRLIAGAKTIFGDRMEENFGQILPVPEQRVVIMQDGDTLTLGANRKLTFLDTPGHAKHHFSVFDSLTQSMFTGDTAGIRYIPAYTGWDFSFVLPSTSPSDFDPDAVHQSLAKMKQYPVKQIVHTHGGISNDPNHVYETVAMAVDAFAGFVQDQDPDRLTWEQIQEQMIAWIREHLKSLGHPVQDLSPLALDLELNSKGLLIYAQQRKQHA